VYRQIQERLQGVHRKSNFKQLEGTRIAPWIYKESHMMPSGPLNISGINLSEQNNKLLRYHSVHLPSLPPGISSARTLTKKTISTSSQLYLHQSSFDPYRQTFSKFSSKSKRTRKHLNHTLSH
jgi:hypothetical protein